MNKEQLYDYLNSNVEELISKYSTELKMTAEKLISELDTDVVISQEEIEAYIKEQEEVFVDLMESILEDIREKIQNHSSDTKEVKETILNRIQESFKRIFTDIISKLKSIGS